MKKKKIKPSYKELAEMFFTTVEQITSWAHAKKFKTDELYSIGLFFVTEIINTIERKNKWDYLHGLYRIHRTNREENKFVEKRLKDWSREDEIKSNMWK